MRLLVYEWCCSGGLTGPDAMALVPKAASASDLEPLTREGRAMFRAALCDGCRSADLEIHAVVDATRPLALPAGVRVHAVAAGDELPALVAMAHGCDLALIIAPETGGILAARVAAVRAVGIEVLAPGPRFLSLAADKQATVLALAAAGMPVPPGRRLAAGEHWPTEFHRPAIGKRLDGVGCDGLVRVGRGDPWPAPANHPLRIEAAVGGLSVGVSCLTGGGQIIPLRPMLQRFSAGNSPGYIGGEPIDHDSLCRRATRLALRSVAAVEWAAGEPACGWVGVDMILGPREDGSEDRVLEINPRLTTSFLGHAAAANTSLLAWLAAPQAAARPNLPDPRSFDVVADAPA